MSEIYALRRTFSEGSYIVIYDDGFGNLITTVVKGSPDYVAQVLQNLAPVPASFILKEDGDFLLLETGDKIIL
jgi:hypothetical protein